MTTQSSAVHKSFKGLSDSIWSYEEGLKSRVIALHKEVHPGEKTTDAKIFQEELLKCHRTNAHNQIKQHLNNLNKGITNITQIAGDLDKKLRGRSKEHDTLSKKFETHKASIKECNETIAILRDVDMRKDDYIATLHKKMEMAGIEHDNQKHLEWLKPRPVKVPQQQPPRPQPQQQQQQPQQQQQQQGEEHGNCGNEESQSLDAAKECVFALMERVENLEEDLRVKETEVEALRIARDYLLSTSLEDKIAGWREKSDAIISQLLRMERQYSLSMVLAKQNDELQETVRARERKIVAISRELEQLRASRDQPRKPHQLDLYYSDGLNNPEARMESESNNGKAIAAGGYTVHRPNVVLYPGVKSSDDLMKLSRKHSSSEEEEVFEDCLSEQGKVRPADVNDNRACPSNACQWPIQIRYNGDGIETVSKTVSEDLSGLDLLTDEGH